MINDKYNIITIRFKVIVDVLTLKEFDKALLHASLMLTKTICLD